MVILTTPTTTILIRGTLSRLFSSPSSKNPIRTLAYNRRFSSASPYPLYYELVHHRPAPRRRLPPPRRHPSQQTPADDEPAADPADDEPAADPADDRAKRRYYRKRRERMYGGSDSDSDNRGEDHVELHPEIVDFPRLHAREEELYFYDAFAFPWEKDKHYRMVYQLEKKYFPDQCLDKAFVHSPVPEPRIDDDGGVVANDHDSKNKKKKKKGVKGRREEDKDERALVFFEDDSKSVSGSPSAIRGVSEKKVEEFFKCLKKVPNAAYNGGNEGEPYLVTRRTQLPPRWDGPSGTVVLVDKPKGWTSFTVCGKLRRLTEVQKVGHAGTLDPMATGLLIVCVGKATKLVDRYQGMVKGYSGVFRLGEATSTWDADSPVIQREPWEHIKDEDIKKIAASFCGEIWQVPPMFSAIKVGGEKMYEKARRGEMVELSPRRISIFQFDIERSLDDRQNLIFRVTSSKGTYIRSLCADFGKALGSCAHLTALRRDSIGEYSADDAWDFQELQELITKGYF